MDEAQKSAEANRQANETLRETNANLADDNVRLDGEVRSLATANADLKAALRNVTQQPSTAPVQPPVERLAIGFNVVKDCPQCNESGRLKENILAPGDQEPLTAIRTYRLCGCVGTERPVESPAG